MNYRQILRSVDNILFRFATKPAELMGTLLVHKKHTNGEMHTCEEL